MSEGRLTDLGAAPAGGGALGLEVGGEQQVLALMRQARPADELGDGARQQRLLPDLIAYVEQAPRRRRSARVLGYGAVSTVFAAAAALALWVSPKDALRSMDQPVVQAAAGELQLLRDAQQRTVRAGESLALEVMDEVHTPSSSDATLTMPTGSQVQVRAASAVQIAQIDRGNYETLRLRSGSVNVKVPKLATGEHFAVVTETSKVVVHGTRFSVDVGARALPGATCVEVEEGLVAVHTAETVHWVGAGESQGCRGVASKPKANETASTVGGDPIAIDRLPLAPAARRSGGASSEPSVTLAEQNRLFQQALTHQRREEWVAAQGVYQDLVSRYPDGPIASEARVQLLKLQSKLEQAR